MGFVDKVRECINKTNMPPITITECTDDILKSVVNDNSFISDSIREYILSAKFICSVLKDQSGNEIRLWRTDKADYGRWFHICHFMRMLSGNEKPIKVQIILTPFKKVFPPKGEPITSNNINSGATNGKVITIWRSEEVDKVLIHELIHYLKMDFCSLGVSPKLEKFYARFKGVDGDDSRCEAYTELLANIIYCQYKNGDPEVEKQFALLQIARILYHFDMTLEDIYGDKGNKIRQSTSCFSYYIVKGALLYNPETIKFLDNLPENFPMAEYLKLLDNSFQNEDFKRIIQKDLDALKRGEIRYETMRWTYP